MQISWHGGYTTKITSKDTTLVIDPYAPEMGPAPFRAKGEILILSSPQDESMSQVSAVSGDPFVMNSPGEYSVRGITLHAMGIHEDNIERSVIRMHIEGISVLYIGALSRLLTEKELGDITKADIDVLILPVGGGKSLNTKQASELVSMVEPRIVIPIHFAIPKWQEKLDKVDTFAKEMGISPSKTEKKIIIKANRLPIEDVETVILVP